MSKKKFVMFTDKERIDIMKNYNDIIFGDKPCIKYPLSKIKKASKGIFISEKKHSKKELCDEIMNSYKKMKYPMVREDSLTSWGNNAAENYGLEIRDILKMKKGDKMKVIMMDRNVGDYLQQPKIGAKYDPRKKGLTYGIYTHDKDLKGKMYYIDLNESHPFCWEINAKAIGSKCFWSPIPKNKDIHKLNPKIKVGWRGPAIKYSDTKHLPKYFVYYNTWWDDSMPFRAHNFLKVNRKKK